MQSEMFIVLYMCMKFHVEMGISMRFTSVLYEKEATITRLKSSRSPAS